MPRLGAERVGACSEADKFGQMETDLFFEFQHVSEGRGARESGARAWRAGNVRKSQQLATTSDRQGQMQGRGEAVDK